MKVEDKLEQLKTELRPYLPMLGKAADAILDQDISSYPIFIVHRQMVTIGIPVVDQEGGQHKWSINASTLEEFATRQLIRMDKVDNFRKVYKNPARFLCLFVLSDAGAQFVFIPRPESGTPENPDEA